MQTGAGAISLKVQILSILLFCLLNGKSLVDGSPLRTYKSSDFAIHHPLRGRPPDIPRVTSAFVYFLNETDNSFSAKVVDMSNNTDDLSPRSFLDNAARMIVAFRGHAIDGNGSISFLRLALAQGCPEPIERAVCENKTEIPLYATCFQAALSVTGQPLLVILGARNEINNVIHDITIELVNETSFTPAVVIVKPTIIATMKLGSCIRSLAGVVDLVESVYNYTLFDDSSDLTADPVQLLNATQSRFVLMQTSLESDGTSVNSTTPHSLETHEGFINFTISQSRAALELERQLNIFSLIQKHQERQWNQTRHAMHEKMKEAVRRQLGEQDLTKVPVFIDSTKESDDSLWFSGMARHTVAQSVLLFVFSCMFFGALFWLEYQFITVPNTLEEEVSKPKTKKKNTERRRRKSR